MPGGASGGSQQAGTTTTTNTPPAYMYPLLGTAAGQATQILANGGAQYYPGQQVAGFSKPQQEAMSGILDKGLNGTPALSAEQGFDTTLLNSGGGSNPYLDQMFGQAAGATQNQLSSEFAGNGRNVAASQPLRGEQLNNLATSMYGGEYDNNMNRALEAGNQAQSLYGTQMGGLQAAEGVGQQVQGLAQKQIDANQQKYNYDQNLPEQTLMQYLQNLGAMQPGSAQSSPYFTNPTANTLGTASSLAGIYSLLSKAGAADGG